MADEGRRMSLVSALRGLVDKHVKQRPRDTIVRNAIEDPAKPLARRVTEEDACEFCVGEADGKPVSPAKASRHFHRFCKCHYLLFFQETRYQDRIVDDDALKSVGVEMEEGAKPDWYERRNALVLAAAGHRVKFLKRHRSGPRRADTLLDGEPVEFKNPTGGGRRTVQNQILKNLYGENKTIIKPQSDVLLISNVRSPMTMSEMEEGLAFAFGPESILTAEEKACVRKVILLDERTGRMRTYEMKRPATGSTLGNGHRRINSNTFGSDAQGKGLVSTRVDGVRSSTEGRSPTGKPDQGGVAFPVAAHESVFTHKMRSGEANAMTVNYKAVEAYSYRKKFDSLNYPRSVRDSLHKQALRMLADRDGTDLERMVAIDARTGRQVVDTYGSQPQRKRVQFSKEQEKRLADYGSGIILLHNHPTSTYPSASDIIGCTRKNVCGSLVACHDGNVYLIACDRRLWVEDRAESVLQKRFNEFYEDALQATGDRVRAVNLAQSRLERENETQRWFVVTKL